ncbi:hypothetical protein DL96DRAFT_1213118 [Flagelloscypha sp. PMI_526]|nr:hypothetical protein DL96DRAFT_1213118 [Flagelloscypha sp. PMI_526]
MFRRPPIVLVLVLFICPIGLDELFSHQEFGITIRPPAIIALAVCLVCPGEYSECRDATARLLYTKLLHFFPIPT